MAMTLADVVVGDERTPGAVVAEHAARAAQGLRDLGIGAGDVVALMMRNDLPYLELMQACRIAGIHFCQVNWHLTSVEVRYILEDSGAKALFIHEDLLAGVREAVGCVAHVFSVARDYGSWRDAHPPAEAQTGVLLGAMGYTSGTTGRPKGVRRLPVPPEQRAWQQQELKSLMEQAFGVREGIRAYVCAPLYHSAPALFAREALRAAELLVMDPRFDAERVLAAIERYRIDTAYLVPAMFARLLALPPEVKQRYDVSSLRVVGCTGSPCAPALKDALHDWWGPVVHETYAATELGLITVATPELARRKPGTAGRPLGSAVVRILDADGRPCATGEVGWIYARQPAYGDFTYHNNPAARAAVERDGLVTLGDMGYLDADGDLFVCDRASDMVISGGVNIYPAEIEAVLAQLPGVADCAVFGIPDAEYGEALLAQVEPVPGHTLDGAQVIAHLRTQLAGFKVPRRIEFVARLPREENGKVAKRRLREPYWAGHARRI